MKASIHDWYTDILLDTDEVKEYCKPGEGADTCSWLTADHRGFVCLYFHKHPSLIERRKLGTIVAMRDGCDKVHNFNTFGHQSREVTF